MRARRWARQASRLMHNAYIKNGKLWAKQEPLGGGPLGPRTSNTATNHGRGLADARRLITRCLSQCPTSLACLSACAHPQPASFWMQRWLPRGQPQGSGRHSRPGCAGVESGFRPFECPRPLHRDQLPCSPGESAREFRLVTAWARMRPGLHTDRLPPYLRWPSFWDLAGRQAHPRPGSRGGCAGGGRYAAAPTTAWRTPERGLRSCASRQAPNQRAALHPRRRA